MRSLEFNLIQNDLPRLFHSLPPGMAAKSKSTSKSAANSKHSSSERLDYLFPQPNLLDQLEQLGLEDADANLHRTSLDRSGVRRDHLDRELELVQRQKEKLELELEVLCLRQVTASPQAPSSSPPAESGSTKKRAIDWPQDFAPGMSVGSEFNSFILSGGSKNL